MDEYYQEAGDGALRSTSRPDGGGGADEGDGGGLVPGVSEEEIWGGGA